VCGVVIEYFTRKADANYLHFVGVQVYHHVELNALLIIETSLV